MLFKIFLINLFIFINWCFWTVVLEKTLESLLDCKEIQPVHPKGNQSWILIGRTDAEAETPILWPPYVKNWPIWKDTDAGKDWRREKGMTEDETVGRHHWFNGQEFEWTLRVGDGQGGLTGCNPWGPKELDTTKWLTWTESVSVFNKPESDWFYISLSKRRHNSLLFSLGKNRWITHIK